MEKIRVALLLSGFEDLNDQHIVESLKEHISDERFELKVFNIDVQNPGKTVQELHDFKPLFTFDFNTKGIIWGEKDNKKTPFHEIVGIVHFTIFTEDPIFHMENLFNLRGSQNTVYMITDLRYGQTLASLGTQNIFYFTPCVNLRLFPRVEEKDINFAFVGNVVDPNLLIESWKQNMDRAVLDFAVEVGEFSFRNPEMYPPFVVDYLLPLMNPQFQEAFNKFRNENPKGYFAWLAQVMLYTTFRRNAFLIGFLEGTETTVIGRVEGNLPEDFDVKTPVSLGEKLQLLGRVKLGMTAYPAFVPSGLGFTPVEMAAAEVATMVNFRSTLPGFFKPNEEIIAYNPLDRMDIEEKLLFYLENEEDRRILAENAFKTVKEKYTCKNRVEFFKELMNSIIEQSKSQNPPGGGNVH
jgi:hypothetical protein